MSRPALYIAITSHGFGHAVRASSVAAAIQRLCPEILLILVTTTPRWLLESYIPGDFIHRPRAFDVGVIQADSLSMDKTATLEKLQAIRAAQNSIIAGEVNFIRTNRVGLVLADIPPLAAKIAKTAGIPSWMMSNFGWDFIYRDWGGEFVEIADWISECYGECDRLFRLPLHEPMAAFPTITDVGLTGGTPRYSLDQLRKKLGLNTPPSQTVLLTFGGLSLQQIPYHTLSQFPDWQFITFDSLAPELPNLLKVVGHDYRPVDFMPLCGRVVSKPGYSTFAEALRLNIPIVSLTREDFAEAPLLLEGIQNYAYHQIVTPTEFFQGRWEFLHRSLQPPKQSHSVAKDGTEAIAQAVVRYFQTHSSCLPQ
ncbi:MULTISPECIES: glycosyl transferase [unclassified Coleofasciculus]|uniref:glycosyl transferase n=1 Tax=unclassified Coleofasciculus TaxID=2692782 RepID=UPI001881C350|nr:MULTISPECIES: glycosyl transferase [unclassified Coleofasciculus]MBE9127564.1 glycosyl transferase [Coleofasciculus sp. LEGE 07081]MBE9147192.1 glycosyl transferase [Coleofasciculus sp. LEGE 07092]